MQHHVTREFHFCAGHRLMRHEGRCRHLHGHNYIASVTVAGPLDDLGRVIDFGVLEATVGAWIDERWDHCLILQAEDPFIAASLAAHVEQRLFVMDVAPTAEAMAGALLRVATSLLTTVEVVRVEVRETPTCVAVAIP